MPLEATKSHAIDLQTVCYFPPSSDIITQQYYLYGVTGVVF